MVKMSRGRRRKSERKGKRKREREMVAWCVLLVIHSFRFVPCCGWRGTPLNRQRIGLLGLGFAVIWQSK